jgi:hypothetical protein
MTSTYYADGQWNFTCQLCGKTRKSSAGVKTWDGFRVCKEHKEVRNPQDLMRGVKGETPPPWTAPQAPDTFVPFTYTPYPNDTITISGGGVTGYLETSADYIDSTYFFYNVVFVQEVQTVTNFVRAFADSLPMSDSITKRNVTKAIGESIPFAESLYASNKLNLLEGLAISSAGFAVILNYVDVTYFAADYVGAATPLN